MRFLHLTRNHGVTAADITAAAVSLAIWAYVALRAGSLSITIDEALTWAWHVSGEWDRIVLFRTPGLAGNNHVLYTLLAKLSVGLFGLSELALRLPSLLGFACFLVGSNLVLRRVVPGWRQVLGILALGLNPYLVDYFSVARGYGLAQGLTALGLSALLAAMCDRPGEVRLGKARAAVLLFALATVANLSFLLVLAAAIAVLWAPLVLRVRLRGTSGVVPPRQWRAAWSLLLPSAPILIYLLRPLLLLRRKGFLAEGGTDGFWHDTVGSLIDGTIHGDALLGGHRWLLYGWVVAILILSLPVLWTLRQKNTHAFAAFAIISGMTLLVAVASILQHWLFDVAYLQGRQGLFLLPLLILWALALTTVPRTAPRALVAAALAAGALVPAALCIHGLMATNMTYVLDWKFDAGARDTMLATKAWIGERQPTEAVRMRANWILAPSGNFYRTTLRLESSLLPIEFEERPGFDGVADLYYVETGDQPAIEKFGVRPLLWSPVAATVLLERVQKPVENPR